MADPLQDAGNAQIDEATRKLLEQYAALEAAARAQQAQFSQQGGVFAGQALTGYQSGTDPALRDLAKQGFNPAALRAGQSMDIARLNDSNNRQQQYFNMIGANQAADISARGGIASTIAAGSKSDLAVSLALARAKDAASGGGGGGGGSGSGDGSDVPTAGDAEALASLSQPLLDVTQGAGQTVRNSKSQLLLDAFLHGTHGQGIQLPNGRQLLPGGFGHVNETGENAALVASKYLKQYDALVGSGQITDKGAARDAFKKNLIQELKAVNQRAKDRAKQDAARSKNRDFAEIRGYDVPEEDVGGNNDGGSNGGGQGFNPNRVRNLLNPKNKKKKNKK